MDSDSELNFDDEVIDLKLIEEFDKSILKYKDFYKENVETIKLKFLYVNNKNKLENIKHDDLILNHPNIITCVELIKILKMNNKIMNKYYKIHSMCLYNVNIEFENIENISEEDFLTNISHINDVKIEPTINILQDLNEMLFVFKENEKQNNRPKTKKTSNKHVKNLNNNDNDKYNNEKKKSNNKTRKKML